jgi:zeta-carotene desaturase
MKKVIVIGGGAAGLSSAVYLSSNGFRVELLEASRKLGGRAYSFPDKITGTIIDNGQHILMGACRETLKFLKLIGAENNLVYQKKLEVNFLKKDLNIFPLKAKPLPYPFNLAAGILNYKAISFKERLILLKFFMKIHFYNQERLKKLSVNEWLLSEGQNENIRKSFWDILVIGIMNTNSKKASAKIFSDVLKEIFFRGTFASSILLPKLGLTEMYCLDSQKFIEKANGIVNLSEEVEEIVVEEGRAVSIKTNKRIIEDFDYLISAVPLYSLKKVIKSLNFNNLEFDYSTILSIHIWLKKNYLTERFYGLIDSPVHWIFNNGTHLTIVISDADKYTEVSVEEIFETVISEIQLYTGLNMNNVTSYKVIKEKRATFVPSNIIIDKRPSPETKVKNLVLAGDWIDTGLPSTIEGAVKSGKMAAETIIKIKN